MLHHAGPAVHRIGPLSSNVRPGDEQDSRARLAVAAMGCAGTASSHVIAVRFGNRRLARGIGFTKMLTHSAQKALPRNNSGQDPCGGAKGVAPQPLRACKSCLHSAYAIYPIPLRPNPSLKRSANGMSRWPSSAGPAAHFALAVQRAMPLSPA